jgi:hypothetical protein
MYIYKTKRTGLLLNDVYEDLYNLMFDLFI